MKPNNDNQQQQQKRKKKKKRSRAAAKPSAAAGVSGDNKKEEEDESRDPGGKNKEKLEKNYDINVIESLMEALGSVSIEEATAAYKEAKGDANRAAEILSDLVEEEDLLMSSVSSGILGLEFGSSSGYGAGSSSSSSEGCAERISCLQNRSKERGFKKRVVAVTGTVSTVLGKDYVKGSPRKKEVEVLEGFKEVVKKRNGAAMDREEAEQFLCSMLGDDCDLSIAVVRDVLCQCGYNVNKASDVLLDMSASSCEESVNGKCYGDAFYYKEDRTFNIEHGDNLTDRASDSMSNLSESELQNDFWGTSYGSRNYLKVLTSSDDPSPTSPTSNESDLPQKVLESLFNITQRPEHEPGKMNWRNVVQKMQSLGPGFNVKPSNVAERQQETYVKGDEYQALRKGANQHWDATKSYYQRAAEAYSRGEKAHSAYLSDQGRMATKLARQADERASHDIFEARNKEFENVITIDLHGQHVKQAMRLLKVHLIFGSNVLSLLTLRVITGCGSHGLGKSKVKQSVISLLEREGVKWCEENRGTLLIKLDGYREFSFLDTESDSE